MTISLLAQYLTTEGDTLTHSGVFPYDSAGTGDAGELDAQIKATLTQIKATFKISSEPVIFSLPSHSTTGALKSTASKPLSACSESRACHAGRCHFSPRR